MRGPRYAAAATVAVAALASAAAGCGSTHAGSTVRATATPTTTAVGAIHPPTSQRSGGSKSRQQGLAYACASVPPLPGGLGPPRGRLSRAAATNLFQRAQALGAIVGTHAPATTKAQRPAVARLQGSLSAVEALTAPGRPAAARATVASLQGPLAASGAAARSLHAPSCALLAQ